MSDSSASGGVGASTSLRRFLAHPFVESALVVLLTYGLLLLGNVLWPSSGLRFRGSSEPSFREFWIVAVITLATSLLPVLIVVKVVIGPERNRDEVRVAWLVAGSWFGFSLLPLVLTSGWPALVGAAAHIALSPRGSRLWRLVEYGSTTQAAFLLTITFGSQIHRKLSGPLVAAMAVQFGLLMLMDLVGRRDATGSTGPDRPAA